MTEEFEKIIKSKGKKITIDELIRMLGEQLDNKKKFVFAINAQCLSEFLELDFKLIPYVTEKTRILIHNHFASISEHYESLCSMIRTIGNIREMTDNNRDNYDARYIMKMNNLISFYIERKDIDKLVKEENDKINRCYT